MEKAGAKRKFANLGILFIFLLSFSLFFVPQYSYAQTAPSSIDCTFIPFTPLNCINSVFTDFIKIFLLTFAGFFLEIAAKILDYSINAGILNFASWAPNEIYPLWQIVRQIVSLCIVFAGLFMGAMYIINKRDDFIKKFLPWLVIFALFVNFSYPITRAAIDISNVISLNIYAQAVDKNNNVNATAGLAIMKSLGLQTLIDKVEKTGSASGLADNLNSPPSALLAVVMVFYAAYIFAFAALLMVVRTLLLVFVIIGSPLLFVDQVVPKLGEKASDLRTFFFNQLAVAPVFMIMLFFAIRVISIFSQGSNTIFNSNGTTTDVSSVAIFLNILMMLGVLHIMLKVTRSLSGSIGAKIEGLYKGAAIGVAAMPLGAAAFAGRATIGRTAAAIGESQWMKEREGGFVGGMAKSTLTGLSNSTFDARNTGAMQKMAGMGGLKDFKGSQKSYSSNLEAKRKTFEDKYNSMENEKAKEEFLQRTRQSQSLQGVALGLVGAGATKITGDKKLGEKLAETDNVKITNGVLKQRETEQRKHDMVLEAYAKESSQTKRAQMYTQYADNEKIIKQMDDINAKRKIAEQNSKNNVVQATPSTNNITLNVTQAPQPSIVIPLNVGNGPRQNHENVGFNGNLKVSNQSQSAERVKGLNTEKINKEPSVILQSVDIAAALRARNSEKKT